MPTKPLAKDYFRGKLKIIPIAVQNGPGRLLWVVSVLLVPMALGAYLLLYNDALNGGHEVWPVYVFASVAIVCAVVWGFLAAKLFAR